MSVSRAILSGLRLRCGQCGKGKLFRRYLQLNDACPVCARDMSSADTADGPAFFVGFGVLILLAPFLFILPMTPWPIWIKTLGFIVLCSALVGLCLLFLPIAKSVLLNLQLLHGAEEARFEEAD